MGGGFNTCYRKVEGLLANIFGKYGRLVARYPWVFIVGSVLVSGCLGVGILRLNPEDDIEKIYTPKDNQASKDRDYMLATYPDNSASSFSMRTRSEIGLFADVIVKTKDGSNVLSTKNINALQSIYYSVLNISVQGENSSLFFDDLCARSHIGCAVGGSFLFTSVFKTDLSTLQVSYPFYTHAIHGAISLPNLLGDMTVTNNTLSAAKYARIRFHVRGEFDASVEWLSAFLTHMESLTSDNLDIAYAHVDSLGEELDKNTTGDIIYVALTFMMMVFYAIFAISGGNCVSNRGFLATSGVLSTSLAIFASIGFVSVCGVDFVSIVGVMPFLILGVGVDDMFILLSGLAEVQHLNTVEERLARTMSSAGLAITITSLTDLLAFCVGSVSVFLSVRNFCIYTGVAVLFCYLNQITFFTACMALHERRVLASRHSITCMVTESKERMKKNNISALTICCCSGSPPSSRDEVEGISERYPRIFLSRVLQYPLVRIMTLFLFAVYLGVAVWGAMNIQEGLLLKDTVADTSYYYKYETFNSHLSFEHAILFVFKENVQYWNASVRVEIENLIGSAQNHSLIQDSFSLSWIRDFALTSEFNDTSETAFILGLQRFLNASPTHFYDVVITNNKIVSSRVYVLTESLKTSNEQGDLMLNMREKAEETGMAVFAYSPVFIFYEQYTVILKSTLLTVGIALAAVVVATFLFMPHPLMMVYVLMTVVMIVVGLFGFMYFWGITLSSITMIMLIMSVGFAIDYSIHTSHAFIQSDSPTRLGKMTVAINMAAAPIVNAALSSFVGILMLLLSKSYVFRTFFKIMFLVIVLGFAHSSFFLPSLLSFIGPKGSSTKHKEKYKSTGEMSRSKVSPMNSSSEYIPRALVSQTSVPHQLSALNLNNGGFRIPRPKIISQ